MKIGKHDIDGKACIMGVLNVTPDSFSDGGSYTSVEKALEQADKMITEGAKIIDVGGESTRPGYTFVEAADEINRVVPVIKALKEKFDVLVSIDTYKTETARAALEAGADILNDVWAGLYDGEMLALAAEKNVPIILMHNQKEEKYDNITKEVCEFLVERAKAALDAGVAKEISGLIQDLVLLKMKHKTLNFCKAWMLFVSLDTQFFLVFPVNAQ